MVVTLELRATQDGVIWPRRPLVSSKGLLSCLQNVPHSSYDRKATCFRAVAFNASGDGFAAADEKGRVFVFFVTNNRYALVQHLGATTVACCFSPTRKSELLVTCENEMIRCIDVHSQSLISSLRGHRFPARSASFQKSGKLALTASQDAVILWDTKDWSRYRVLNAGPGVEEAAFVAKGDLVAVCFQDDSIMMWELDSLALRYRYSLPPQEKPAGLNKIEVAADYKVLVATGRSRFIYVWDFESQTIIRIIELPPPIEEILTFSFVPGHDSTICLLGSEGSLFFLDVAAKKPKIKLEISNPCRKISAFDIDSHGRYLVACTEDGCLLLYDLDIANETARRAQMHRRQQGFNELEDNLRLRTRSGIRLSEGVITASAAAAVRHPLDEEDDVERPATSKLIDGIFGLKSRRGKENIAAAERVEFQDKRLARGEFSPHTPTPVKPVARQSMQTVARQKSVLQRTTVTDEEMVVNRRRLENSLECNGRYPSKYRLLVWKFLLRLPKNDGAFKALIAKGPHPAYVNLHEQYPLKNRRHLRRLHRVLSAIAYWCPAFGEVSYLPAIVYPFVKIYRENDVAAFEASLGVLLHWCRDFLVSLPLPPVLALSAIETQLEKLDPQLHDHFTKHGVTTERYAWSLLKTIFTEVLSEEEWLRLWDHLFTASDKPWMLQVAVLAYLSYFRTALLAAKDKLSIEQFFHQQNALQINAFLQLFKNLSERIGDFSITNMPTPNEFQDPVPTYWPLPRGQYPAFANYPKFIVDFQISERNRIAMEEAEMIQKKKLFERVESECDKLKSAHRKWLQQRQTLLKAEEKRRSEMLAAEKSRILSLRTLDHETRKRRLERLAELEKAAQETLVQTSNLFQAEFLRLESELEMMKERTEFEIGSRREEEELQRVEFETEKRVADIHRQRELDERLQQLRTEFVTRVKQDELQDLLLFERWKRDDEAQRLHAKHDIEKREKQALLQQERTLRQQLENRMLDHALEKEQQLLDLQTQRAARVQEVRVSRRLGDKVERHEHEMAQEATNARRESERMPRQRSAREHGNGSRSQTPPETTSQPYPLQQDGQHDGTVPSVRDVHQERARGEGALSIQDEEISERQSVRGISTRRRSAVADESDEDHGMDGTQHVTHESIRMLETARRRLSSVLHQSNEVQSSRGSSSNSSSRSSRKSDQTSDFASAPIVRTQEETSLLERALADISSSSSGSSHGNGPATPASASHRTQMPSTGHAFFEGISPIHTTQKTPSISVSNATALLQDETSGVQSKSSAQRGDDGSQSTAVAEPTSASAASRQDRLFGMSMPSLSSGDESEEASSMLQRPIEELEKELGIRFDELSGDERDGSEEEDDDDDDEMEDDRAQLLLRAKKLLAEQSLLSEDEDGDDDDGNQV